MTDHRNTLISAQVVLNSGDDFNENNAHECENYFRDAGFELGPRVGESFAITASLGKFEKIFNCHIVIDENGAHVDIGNDSIDYELPFDSLYAHLQNCIYAVTFSAPPDFGPGNF